MHGGAWRLGNAADAVYKSEMFVDAGAQFVAVDFTNVIEAIACRRVGVSEGSELGRRSQQTLHLRSFIRRSSGGSRAHHRLAEGFRSKKRRAEGGFCASGLAHAEVAAGAERGSTAVSRAPADVNRSIKEAIRGLALAQ